MIANNNPQNNQPHDWSTSALASFIRSVCEKIEAKDKTIEMLLTRMQNLEKKYATLEERQSYLEYDLHNDNGNLKAENLGLRQLYGVSED